MTAELIDGREVASRIRGQLKIDVGAFTRTHGRAPGLAVVIVGDDPASHVYVRMKEKATAEIGMRSEKYHLPGDTTQDELIQLVHRLGEKPDVDGILVQLPLPAHIDEQSVLSAVNPAKDVDGFHPINAGKLFAGGTGFVPCTPAGIIELIRHTGVPIAGKEAVVIGRSLIVGRPVSALLLNENATVTICHSRTQRLAEVCRRADILVVAIGRPQFVTKEFVKPGAIVIDVGVNRLPSGQLVGDVHFDEVKEVAGHITPVPGGVGPMTITMLLKNTLMAARELAQGTS